MAAPVGGHRRSRSYALGGTFQPLRQGHVFEHFLLVGLPSDFKPPEDLPTNGSYVSVAVEPKILFQYPRDAPDVTDQISTFCFPEGAKIRAVEGDSLTKSNSSLLEELIPDELSISAQTSNSFIFLLQAGENLLYGICVHQEEVLEYTPSLIERGRTPTKSHKPKNEKEMQTAANNANNLLTKTFAGFLDNVIGFTKEEEDDSDYSSDDDHNVNGSLKSSLDDRNSQQPKRYILVPRCYCFISRFPFFKTHYAVLYGLTARERLRFKSKPPPGDLTSSELLGKYYDQHVPLMGETVRFTVDGDVQNFSIASGGEDTLIADWCIPVLFKVFNLNQILKILTSLMLEKQVVVVSQNLGVLSAIILSFIPILRPFVWQGPLITVLPHSMYEGCLYSPVPTVVGLRVAPELTEGIDYSLIVDVDNTSVTATKGELPTLPNYKKLYTDLKDDYAAIHSTQKRVSNIRLSSSANISSFSSSYTSPYSTTDKEIMISKRIIGTFRAYQAWLTGKIARSVKLVMEKKRKTFDLSDPECTAAIANTFIPEELDFIKSLFQTQQFMVYSEKLVGMLNSKETQRQQMLQRLEDDIKIEKHLIEMHKEVIAEHQKQMKESEERLIALEEARNNLMSSSCVDKVKLDEIQDNLITDEEITRDQELLKLGLS